MKIHLGVNNAFIIGRYPRPKEWLKILDEEMGVKIVQCVWESFDFLLPKYLLMELASEIKEEAEKRKINIHSVFTGYTFTYSHLHFHPVPRFKPYYLEILYRMVDIISLLGGVSMGTFLGALPIKEARDPLRREELILIAIQERKELASYAKEKGLKYLMIEPMSIPREPPHTIEETKVILEKLNEGSPLPFLLCLDTGHGKKDGGVNSDPYIWIKELGKFTACIHLQQTDGKFSYHWPFTPFYNQRGIIHPPQLLKALESSGVEEIYLFLEIAHPRTEESDLRLIKDYKESLEYWRKFIPES